MRELREQFGTTSLIFANWLRSIKRFNRTYVTEIDHAFDVFNDFLTHISQVSEQLCLSIAKQQHITEIDIEKIRSLSEIERIASQLKCTPIGLDLNSSKDVEDYLWLNVELRNVMVEANLDLKPYVHAIQIIIDAILVLTEALTQHADNTILDYVTAKQYESALQLMNLIELGHVFHNYYTSLRDMASHAELIKKMYDYLESVEGVDHWCFDDLSLIKREEAI